MYLTDYLLHVSAVTALDRANAEDALLPMPKISNLREIKKQSLSLDANEVIADLVKSRSSSKSMENTGKFRDYITML